MSSRGKRQLSSKADDVPIATKRRKGRGWAPSQGEEEETSAERERTVNNSDMKVSSIYNRSTTDAPAELFRKDLISAMKLPDSEPLAPEDYWLISDQWKQEWERGVQVPVNPDSLPSPVSAPSQLIIRPRHPFTLPKNKYIRLTKDVHFRIDDHYLSNIEMQSNMSCSYDSDELDLAWLNIMNKERLAMNLPEISRDQMESVIEELEMRCWQKVNDIIKKEEGLALEFDESVVCDVCRSPDSEDGNEMVFCDCCNICVHQACYGITTIPAGSWLCRTCALGLRPECVLCPNKNGAMKSTRSGQKWAHVSCALWIPEVSIGCVEKMEPITKISGIPQSRWALICVLCRERVGACIQCSVKTCKTAYHVTCAFKHGLEMRAIIEDESTSEDDNTVKLRSYCSKHSINTKKDQNDPHSDEEGSKKKHISTNTNTNTQRKEISSEEKNQARAAKLSEVEAEFEKYVTIADVSAIHEVDDEAIRFIYSYWILKRRAGFNKPLLPAKTEDTSLMYRNGEEHLDQERIKMFVQLRQDLERVRNLCYMVGKREKLSRSFLKLREQTFYKQATVLSDPAVTLDSLELEAIKNANRNASVYDKLYSSVWDDEPCPDLELMVSRIAGADRSEERLRIRNNGALSPLEDNMTNGIDGVGMYRNDRSLYSSLSSSELEDIKPDPDYRRYPLLNSRKRERKRMKRKDRPISKLDHTNAAAASSDDDGGESKQQKERKSRTLKKMVEELRSSEDTDDFEIIKINFNYDSKKKGPKDIYSSDTDSNISLKDSGIYSDLQKGTMPTKASVKDFAANKAKSNNINNSSSTKEKMKKVDELFDEIKQDTAKRKTKTVKDPVVPPDLIVPQRQAAKKAETIFKSQTRRKSSDSLSDDGKVSKKPVLPDKKKIIDNSKMDGKKVVKQDKQIVKKQGPISQKVQATKKPIVHGKNGMIKEDKRMDNKDIKPNIVNITSTTTTISVVRMRTEQKMITGKKIGNCSTSSSSSSSSNSSSGSSSSSSSSSSGSGSSSGSSSSSSCSSDSDDEMTSSSKNNRMSSKLSNNIISIDKDNDDKDAIKLVPIINNINNNVNKIKPMPKCKKKELELQQQNDKNNEEEIPSNNMIKIENEDIKRERERSVEKVICDYRHSLFSPPKDIMASTTSDFLGLGGNSINDNDEDLLDMPNLSFHEFVLKEDSKEDTNRETLDLVDKLRKGMAEKVNSTREKMESIDDDGSVEFIETDGDTSVTMSSGDVTKDDAEKEEKEKEDEEVKEMESKEISRFSDDTPSELCIDPSRQKLDRCDTGQSDERWVPPSEYEAESPTYISKWSDSVVMPSRRSNCSSSSSTHSENQTKIDEETQSQIPNTTETDSDKVVPISKLPDKEEPIPDICLPQTMPQLDPIPDVHAMQYSPTEKPLELDTDMSLSLPNLPPMEKGLPDLMMGLGPSQKCIPDMMHFPHLPFPHFPEHHFPYSNSSTFMPHAMNMYPPPPHSNPLPYPTPGTIFTPSFTTPFSSLHSFSSKQLDEALRIQTSCSSFPGSSHNLAFTSSMISPLAKVLEESSRPMPYDPFAIGNLPPSDISNCSYSSYNNTFDICPVPPTNDNNMYSKSNVDPFSDSTNSHKEFTPPVSEQGPQINCIDHQSLPSNSDFLLKPVELMNDEATSNVPPKTETNKIENSEVNKLDENVKPINEAPKVEDSCSKEEPIKTTNNENPPQSNNTNDPPPPESKNKTDGIGSPGMPLTPASSNKVHGFNKKSPAKPTRISARVLSQGKSPAKSPAVNQSPQQIADTKSGKGSNNKKNKGRTSQGNARGRGRGRGRGRNNAPFVCRDSELEIQSKLVGTVYDLDFDEDISSESIENLKSMRDRRKSSDLYEGRFNEKPKGTPKYILSPKFASPARSERKKSSRTPNTEEIPLLTLPKKDTIDQVPEKEVPNNTIDNEPINIIEKFAEVEPLLPGPVDMRRYNSQYSEPLTPCSSYTNSILGTYSTSSVDEVPTILADLEKELRNHTNMEEPSIDTKSDTKSDTSVTIIEETDTPSLNEDSRNQLKVKIKGPMGHLDSNYPNSITSLPVAPILPSTPIIDLTLPSTGPSSVTGSTNLRRMRKKELLHQYWNQDMNMDESTAGAITMNHVTATTTSVSPPRQIITIPKAVASMTSIPTKEDYRAVLDANMEKKKRKEYQQTSSESLNSYQLDDIDRIRSTNGPVENSIIKRKGTTPKLKIKFGGATETIIEPFVTPIMEEKNLRLRPPKKRLCEPEQQPVMPTMEELKRDSMKFRCKVMSEFEGKSNDTSISGGGGRKRKKKSNGEKSTKHKKRNSIRIPHVQVIETTEFAPKLIIRFGHKNHNNNDHNHNSKGGGPSPMADVATCATVPNNSNALQPASVRTSKISPIRLKLSRHKEGYIMKSCDTLPETCAESNYTCNINL